uniref:Uncharacterized protein n=1 Tax=viral metagenome TaxID=1070528 RepID=A0A6C0KFE1_9ZZZZ
MCSTTIKNSPNDYCIQESNKDNYASLVYYKHKLEAYNTQIPDAGINMGPINASILSHNYADIDSFLKGTYFNNLEKPRREFTPRIKKFKSIAFFDRLTTYIPEPLVIENCQRPDIFRR